MIRRRIEPLKSVFGPQDHGRRVSLAEFDPAEVQEGYRYELNRGVIEVSDVPDDRQLAQVDVLRVILYAHRAKHPKQIHRIATGGECKILLYDIESERHPDLAIYKKPRPRVKNYWTAWVPEVVIEVISPRSEERDYQEKREEYLRFGVREYWIFDADKQEMLALCRVRDQWREKRVHPPEVYRTRLLPGFSLQCALVFQAAEDAEP